LVEQRLLLVGVGEMGRGYLSAAHARGVAVSVVETSPRLETLRAAGLLEPADRGFPVGGRSEPFWFAAARAAAADASIDGVVAFSERHVVAAGLLADELGLRGPGLRAAVASRNKALQRHAFERAGLLQPLFALAETQDDAAAWAARRYPVVVKPLDGTGSSRVEIVADEHALRASGSAADSPVPFLVEEFLGGPERSCEAIVADGRLAFAILTEKETTSPPTCVELAHSIPAPEPAIVAGMEDAAHRVARALGMRDGIMHLELKLEADGPHVLEVAVRTPGDFIMDIAELATGLDLYGAVVDVALGRTVDARPRRQRAAGVWFPAPPVGTVAGVDGLERLPELPGVVRCDLRLSVGDRIPPLRSSRDRIGAVVVEAPDRKTLAARLEAAKRALRIDVVADGARGTRAVRAARAEPVGVASPGLARL
jgi:biotin carboxylase